MNTARNSVEKDLCIGCGYCAAQTGCSMQFDGSGYLVPEPAAFELKASAETLVRASCPGANAQNVVTEGSGPEGALDDYMWGRHYRVVTAWSTDDETRFTGSSGGVLTGLAKWLVESGRVDGVLVTSYNEKYPIGTTSSVADTTVGLMAGAGSKYCPAAPLAALGELKERKGRYAVIGRPCDIATLRRAINAGDPIAAKVEVLLSFFCAGTPSDAGNKALLRKLGIADPAQVVRFRHRGNGWPGDTRADLADGNSKTCTYNESWGNILRRHVHTLCKICPDGIGEQADIVAADAWYGDEGGYPTFDEAKGRSLLMARTALGRELFEAALSDGALNCETLDIREIDRMQPGQINRRRQLALRVLAYRLTGHAVPEYNRSALKGYQRGMQTSERLRVFAATLRRLLVLRLRAIKAARRS